jgi:uncharacterized membrane protein YesL
VTTVHIPARTTPPDGPTTSPPPAGTGTRTERWFAVFDTIAFVGLLNLLILAFTLAGAIVAGWAPALAAATTCSRTRLRGDNQRLVRAFAGAWRGQLVRANLLAAPPAVGLALLATNLVAFAGRPGTVWLTAGLCAAAAVCAAHLVLVLTMDAHYDLPPARTLRLAWLFMVRFPGAPLLLAATTALVVTATAFVPGLLPVVSIGAWTYLCTALCLSFYAANDRTLQRPHPATTSTE